MDYKIIHYTYIVYRKLLVKSGQKIIVYSREIFEMLSAKYLFRTSVNGCRDIGYGEGHDFI